jgi:hypothetical protein
VVPVFNRALVRTRPMVLMSRDTPVRLVPTFESAGRHTGSRVMPSVLLSRLWHEDVWARLGSYAELTPPFKP